MRFSSPMFLSQGWLLRGLSIAGAIALTLTGLLVSAPAQSQNAPGDAPDRRHSGGATYIKFKPPTLGNTLSNAPGGRQRGGGSRGDCPLITQPLTALAPETVAGAVGGLTTEDHPTFWFYVPYALTDEHPAEFVLLDEQINMFIRRR
ncbi:MAG: DUF928 domain-containing protein [Leptolyngbyaceae cyanobacterium CRU_2_3]|nr:DUF928 domain-containing protein [Leptolyngbyaceae cyanobacterium CRU_2_3]